MASYYTSAPGVYSISPTTPQLTGTPPVPGNSLTGLNAAYMPSNNLTGPSLITTGANPINPAYSNALLPGSTVNTTTAPVTYVNPETGTSTTTAGLTPGQIAANQLLSNTAPVAIPKNPAITAATQNLLTASQNIAGQATTTFDEYLAQAQQQLQGINSQVAGATKTLNALPSTTSAQLGGINAAYATALNNASNTYAGINANNQTQVQGNIAQANDIVNQEAAAIGAAGTQAAETVGGQLNKQWAGSGVATSLGSTEIADQEALQAGINVQTAQQIAAAKQGVLQNYISPQEQQLYAQNVAQAVQFATQVAQQIQATGTASTEYIAQLATSVAGMPTALQIQALSAAGIPFPIINQVLAGATNQLATLSGVSQQNTNYGLAQAYQNALSGLPTAQTPSAPRLPNTGPVTSGQQAIPGASQAQIAPAYNAALAPTTSASAAATAPIVTIDPATGLPQYPNSPLYNPATLPPVPGAPSGLSVQGGFIQQYVPGQGWITLSNPGTQGNNPYPAYSNEYADALSSENDPLAAYGP